MDQEECFYDSLDEEQFNKEVRKSQEQKRKKKGSRIPVLVGSTIGPCRYSTSLSLRSANSSLNNDVKSICSRKSTKSSAYDEKTGSKIVATSKKTSVIPLKLVLDVQNDLIEKELRQKKRTYLEIMRQRLKDSSYNSSYCRAARRAGRTGKNGNVPFPGCSAGAAAGTDADSASILSNCNSCSTRPTPSTTCYSTFSYQGPECDTASMYDNYKVYPASNLFELKKVSIAKNLDEQETEDEKDSNKKNPEIKELMPAKSNKSESMYIEKCTESNSFSQLENIMNNLRSVSEVCVMYPGKSYKAYKKDDYEALKQIQVGGGLGADMLSPARIQKLEKMKKMTEYGLKASIRNRAKIIAKIKIKEN